MRRDNRFMLNRKQRYLQVALNGTLHDARAIIAQLPVSDRIIVEAGTPLIKRYGAHGIATIKRLWRERTILGKVEQRFTAYDPQAPAKALTELLRLMMKTQPQALSDPQVPAVAGVDPYVVADLKTMDRGATEVALAAEAGANAAIALGLAPTETLNAFIAACHERGLDAMVDMMNVEFPLTLLRALKRLPQVVILHRGVDEESFNREKQIPFHEIHRIKANYNIMISIAGGDTIREVQRAIFNDADIVVVWKSFFAAAGDTGALAQQFLDEVK